jgi:3-dehydroquinate synthase
VVIDVATLATLPEREYFSGLAEVVKYAFIRDPEFLPWLEAQQTALIARDPVALEQAIARSCRDKAAIVVADPLEKGPRALLNLGHTFAHAIETELGYGVWLHGEAVAAGMVLAFQLAEALGRLPDDALRQRLVALLAAFRLPTRLPAGLDPDRLIAHMRLDKKNVDAGIRYVLPDAQGQSQLVDGVDPALVRRILSAA